MILVLGATGMLGEPASRKLIEMGNHVRMLVRNVDKARKIFGHVAEIVGGSALSRDNIRSAMAGCDAVHVGFSIKQPPRYKQGLLKKGS